MTCVRPCRLRPPPLAAPARRCARALSSTRPVRARDDDDDLGQAFVTKDAAAESGGGGEIKYNEWIQVEGPKWRDPDPLGTKWLGGDVPFPLNPTFRPPAPVSDALRTAIYAGFRASPDENSPRTLSGRYGVSIQRVAAIIRLKALEEQWKKSKPLQTGFQVGMERLLGLNIGGRPTPVPDEVRSGARQDAAAADAVAQHAEGARGRALARTFFEPVDEHAEPVAPRLLDAARRARAPRAACPATVVQPDPAKPAYRFVDVGLRWVDRADVERRAREGARRKTVRHVRKAVAERMRADDAAADL